MSRTILAIDQGTTGTTVLVLDPNLSVLARVTREFPQIYPRPGWVEHNPEDIWASADTEDALHDVLDMVDSEEISYEFITH